VSDQNDYTVFETRNGHVAVAWNVRGVSSLRLPSASAQAAETSVLRRLPGAQRAAPPPPISALSGDIVRYFQGEEIDFASTPVDLGAQSDFFSGVYDHIRKLGWGETTTYGAVAKALGAEPQAARDVGQAMAANPVPLIVPCHRVLAAGGKIGGFSAPGGSNSKARMLEIEGAAPSAEALRDPAKAKPSQLGFDF
jgi:methylated-DNA-[protein]-cysteine S-methyltransferase